MDIAVNQRQIGRLLIEVGTSLCVQDGLLIYMQNSSLFKNPTKKNKEVD